MIVRVAFFILMSMGLIGFGTVAWITTRPAGLGGTPATKMILVAAQQIQGGSLLVSEDIVQKEIPIDEMVKEYNVDTLESRRGLMGAMVKRALGAGEAIRSDDLMRPSDHGFMAAVLSPGMRAVTINLDAASGSSGLIWPGDRVDLPAKDQRVAHRHEPRFPGRPAPSHNPVRCHPGGHRPTPADNGQNLGRSNSLSRHPCSRRQGGARLPRPPLIRECPGVKADERPR